MDDQNPREYSDQQHLLRLQINLNVSGFGSNKDRLIVRNLLAPFSNGMDSAQDWWDYTLPLLCAPAVYVLAKIPNRNNRFSVPFHSLICASILIIDFCN